LPWLPWLQNFKNPFQFAWILPSLKLTENRRMADRPVLANSGWLAARRKRMASMASMAEIPIPAGVENNAPLQNAPVQGLRAEDSPTTIYIKSPLHTGLALLISAGEFPEAGPGQWYLVKTIFADFEHVLVVRYVVWCSHV
jgi:hypothetical protein